MVKVIIPLKLYTVSKCILFRVRLALQGFDREFLKKQSEAAHIRPKGLFSEICFN